MSFWCYKIEAVHDMNSLWVANISWDCLVLILEQFWRHWCMLLGGEAGAACPPILRSQVIIGTWTPVTKAAGPIPLISPNPRPISPWSPDGEQQVGNWHPPSPCPHSSISMSMSQQSWCWSKPTVSLKKMWSVVAAGFEGCWGKWN